MQNFKKSAEKNKHPILVILRQYLCKPGLVLEIGSGSGQHAIYFSQQLPHLNWQATETAANLPALHQNLQQHGANDLPSARLLDVQSLDWPLKSAQYIYSANTLHIMPWPVVSDFFAGIGRTLPPGGLLCVYGAMCYNSRHTSTSNARFDRWLKEQHPDQGIRNFESVDRLAQQQGLDLLADETLPSHNQMLIWQRSHLHP